MGSIQCQSRVQSNNTTYDVRQALAGDVADVPGVLAEAWRADITDRIVRIVLIRGRYLGQVVKTLFSWTSSIEVLRSFLRWALRRLPRRTL